ncbi:ubiquinone biosynthesis protein UbiB [Betaproteobacteria bacterium SCN2]|jgi:ubiquinone biosynthesis protein|nr:ubiquinone biosynthesis protein UbiB [Betaproteobacteria bacterium SCN2]
MLWETITVIRDLHRLHEIASIMIRYGWGDLVRLLGMAHALERAGRLLHWQTTNEISRLDPAVRIRMALEELGPTFIKFGQLMATRVDMFPPAWIDEFEKLHQRVPPSDYALIHAELTKALGRPPEEAFAEFEAEPLAAASIAQVHRAVLADGSRVVVKVRRPGIEAKIEADLRILEHVAKLVESEMPDMRRYQPVRMVGEFRRSIIRELDMIREARNIDKFSRNFAHDENVHIPRVYWEYTSHAVNVQEELRGIKGVNREMLAENGLDAIVLGSRGSDVVLKMILLDGYFHADPHPGNIIFLPGNRIGIIDFGMIGHLTERRRNEIVNLLHAIVYRDENGIREVLLDWAGDAEIDEARLTHDLAELVFSYDDLKIKDVNVGALLQDITTIMRDNSLVLPADLTLLFKTIITLEGLGQQLNPDYHMVDQIQPFIEQVIGERYTPQALMARGRKSLREVAGIIAGLPRDLSHLLREARRGRIRIDLDLKRLDHFGHQLDQASNRLTMGILTASLVIGSSIIMTVEGGPTLFGLPLFGLLGFLIAFFNSLWILFSIWRSGKH